MSLQLAGVSICMLGGDLRELELAQTLGKAGADLRLVGFPPNSVIDNARYFSDPRAACQGAPFIICPMSNTDMDGRIFNRLDNGEPIDLTVLMPTLPAGTTILIGVVKPIIQRLARRYNINMIETSEIDEIAVLNSIPTAEGAIQLAMSELPITIHGSKCLVVGFGRCGITLARDLNALGADVIVAARNRGQLARAREMGLRPLPLEDLESYTDLDVIFNTVPSLVLTRPYLRNLPKSVLIIDLAAAPGGVDFSAAAELGIKAILALSLPGKVAPVSAGRILSECVPRLLQELLGGETNGT